MASQLRFEGPDLEELLDRVRTEVGADARIVAANKVRKGGIGGFFSREYFEVVLEGDGTDTPEPAPEPAPVTKAASGARGADATPRAAQVTTGEGGRRTNGRSVPASVLDRPAATSILDLAEDVNDDERRSTPTPKAMRSSRSSHDPAEEIDGTDDDGDEVIDLRERPRVSTESDRFASILERLAREATAPGGGSGAGDDDVEEEFVADDHQLHAMNGSRAGRGAAAAARNGTEAPPRRLATAVRPTEDTPELRARAEAAAIAADEQRRTAAAAAAGGLASASAPGFVAPATPEPPNVRRRGVNTPDVIERPENRLARLGVPARMIPRNVAPRELQGALIESLARLPVAAPLPSSNGVVIAVAGLGSAPVVLARELSAELGLDPDRVVLATPEPLGEGVPSWLQITDAPTAEERRRSWRRRGNPTIVAISVPVGRAGLGWARTILDELEPTMVWAIVDAGWKPEDVRHWEERLGGIDQLQLTRLDETVSPAAVLELGIPVGRLERHLATPVAWAEMLLYRMGAER